MHSPLYKGYFSCQVRVGALHELIHLTICSLTTQSAPSVLHFSAFIYSMKCNFPVNKATPYFSTATDFKCKYKFARCMNIIVLAYTVDSKLVINFVHLSHAHAHTYTTVYGAVFDYCCGLSSLCPLMTTILVVVVNECM